MAAKQKDVVFALAALHAFLAAFPALVKVITGTLQEDDPLLQWLIGNENLQALVNTYSAQAYFESTQIVIMCFSFGYWRIYQDGPDKQPLVLCLGGIAKLYATVMLARDYFQGRMPIGIVYAILLPDLLFGLYFVRVWAKLKFSLVATGSSEKED